VAISANRRVALTAQIESVLVELAAGISPAVRTGPGRPAILPSAVLWTALTIGVLRGAMSQAAIWRIVTAKHLWRGPHIAVSDEAVYRRLATADPSPLAALFRHITELLRARVPPSRQQMLAPFATDVIVIDETTLDPVARSLPTLRALPGGHTQLLPGKVAGAFDARRQVWVDIQLIDYPHQNEKVMARDLVAALAPKTLVLADLGYFGFQWFDDLTDAGHWWISRVRTKTSHRVQHVSYQDNDTFDGLVWLGAHRADRGKHRVRLVRYTAADGVHSFFTNVLDPHLLSIAEIAHLYARRWDIELAVKLVKRELGLHLLWSAKHNVIVHQIWAVLLIAQILQALRVAIAERAEVDLFAVSMTLMVRYLPEYAARFDDPIGAFVEDGERMKFIRPSTRINVRAPTIPLDHYTWPPANLETTQTPRYANRNCGRNRPPT
jgi:hypothetical protein